MTTRCTNGARIPVPKKKKVKKSYKAGKRVIETAARRIETR